MNTNDTNFRMTLFYELIQVALGEKERLSRMPSDNEWMHLYEEAERQLVTSVAFDALEVLNRQGLKPPFDLLCDWIGYAEQIKVQNLLVNKRSVEVSQIFSEAGFSTCILKGQGNARLYPNPLARVPGDIDLWVVECEDGTEFTDKTFREKVDKFVHKSFSNVKSGRMHIDYPIFNDVKVEAHYFPRYMFAPWHNKRLQAFFKKHAKEQINNVVSLAGAEGVCAVATTEFNVMHQMAHMMSHTVGEGVGLRQFVDYYYVLKSIKMSKPIINDWATEFRQVGLYEFAQGVMWIEKNLLGIDDTYLIVEPSERVGRFIQKIIERGGNFGHYDKLNTCRRRSCWGRIYGGAYQSLRALRYFPTEVMWKIIGRVV